MRNAFVDPDIPDSMTFLNGQPVNTKSDWESRRREIRKLWCDYFIGHFPKDIPKLLSAKAGQASRTIDDSYRRRIILTFDTLNQKSFEIDLWEPKSSDVRLKPLLLTQPRYYQRLKWGEEALKRGYTVCIYPGLDLHHSEQDYPSYETVWELFRDEYPEATWGSSLGIQAWLASRTLDYLLDPQYNHRIDNNAVGITGFSRYGKQAIYAAAFDERFTCVVARSSGTPTSCSYRFSGRHTFMESISREDCPEAWLVDDSRVFYGRENELSIEGNSLLACIAPRYLMLDTAYNDGCDPTFGVERNYLSAKKAWAFLGQDNKICLSYRKGNHDPVTDEQVSFNLDFFDLSFGRQTDNEDKFSEVLIHAFDWNDWKSKQYPTDLITPKTKKIRTKIEWMLGQQPILVKDEGKYHIIDKDELPVSNWSRDRWNPGGISRVSFSFGAKMHGNIFFDSQLDKYQATVIWLHPWNYSHGSNEGYGVQETTIYYRLAKEGYIVVMYDQFGFGDHLSNAFDFYDRHPHWSRMGRAIYDMRKVLDFLNNGEGVTDSSIPATDPSQIYVLGFAFGGMVGLYSSALDERISGVACFSGFTPMRTDNDTKSTGGIRRYWEWHSIIPKLGLFHQKESMIPYDYDDIIEMIAPRKCLVYSPEQDRFNDIDDVKQCITKAKKSWINERDFSFICPKDICRFQKDQQDVALTWLQNVTQ